MDKERIPEGLRTVEELWNPAFRGRVEVLLESRDTVGLITMSQGRRIDRKFGDDQFYDTLEVLTKQLDDGQIRQIAGGDYKEDLISEDAVAVIAWSGDISQLNATKGDRWVVRLPESGGTLWSDNLLIPIGSPHAKNASRLMNYYYDPKVAAEVAAYVNYVCPVKGAREEILECDDAEARALADDQLIFPTEDTLKNVQVFYSLDAQTETKYAEAFQKVLSG